MVTVHGVVRANDDSPSISSAWYPRSLGAPPRGSCSRSGRSQAFCIAICVGLSFGCSTNRDANPQKGSATESTAALQAPDGPDPAPTVERTHGQAPAIHWQGDIDWVAWDIGQAHAREARKPLMLLVYTDWCAMCRSLGAALGDPAFETLSEQLVMVRQNHEEKPPWLEALNPHHGSYVPRVVFFDHEGNPLELTSGHPEYPYFYAAEYLEILKRNMRAAVGATH